MKTGEQSLFHLPTIKSTKATVVMCDLAFQKLQYCNCNAKMIYGNCYLLFVICNTKNSFLETVNCQTVTQKKSFSKTVIL